MIPLGLVMLMGGGLRLYHLDCGLPDVVYVDAFKFVDNAQRMIRTGAWAPDSYQYPGFYTNLLAVLYWFGGVGSVYGAHLLAQSISALFGVGLILVTYVAARQVCARGGALVAAALTAFSIVFVTLSRLPAPDCILAFFMTAGVWMLARTGARARHLLAAGVFLGLAIGTKFTGLYLGLFIALAIAIPMIRTRAMPYPVASLVLCGLLAVLALLITTPWIFSRFMEYEQRFVFELQIQQHGQIGRGQKGFLDYLISSTPTWEQPWLGTSILHTDGPLVLIAGLLGCIIGLRGRCGTAAFLHSLYVVLYLALISRPGHLKAIRFLAPILPSLYIMSAWSLERLTAFGRQAPRKALWGCAALLLLAIPAFRSLNYVSMTGREMTPCQVLRWIQDHIPQGARVFISPFFLSNLEGLPYQTLQVPGAGSRQYRVPGDVRLNTELMPIYHAGVVDDLTSLGAQYIVTNSYYDDAFSDIPDNRRWFPRSTQAYQGYLERLKRQAKRICEIAGQRAHRLGPDVRIYRIAPGPE